MAEKLGTSKSEEKDTSHKCKDCKIVLPDINSYVEHLESKEHIKGVMKKKYGEKYLEAKAQLDGKIPDSSPKPSNTAAGKRPETSKEKIGDSQKQPEKSPENTENVTNRARTTDELDSSDEDGEVYTCDTCKKVCTGYLSYRLHLEGKKHLKTVRKIKLLEEMKTKNLIQEPSPEAPKEESLLDQLLPRTRLASDEIKCEVCNKKCTGPAVYKQHCESEGHKKKIALQSLKKKMESEGVTVPNSKDEANRHYSYCNVCQKEFSGLVPYIQHMESPAHLKQGSQVEDLVKFKDLIISSKEDSKLQCKECGKTFSGLEPFKDHMNSSVHRKLKKKTDLMESLERKHPEMVKAVAEKSDDDSDEEEDVILGCEICHVVFSGPEVARDHFASAKHKKTKKKKAEFQKFKQQKKPEKLSMATIHEKKKLKKTDKKTTEGNHDSSDLDEFDIIPPP